MKEWYEDQPKPDHCEVSGDILKEITNKVLKNKF